MTAIHYLMSFIRKIRNRGQVYYAEVENRKVNGKVVQRYIRYVGKRPDDSRNFTLDTVHFGYIATRLMQGDLTANELLDMLEGMGHRVPREDLEAVGIRYSFKKNSITLSLYNARKSGERGDAGSAARSSSRRRRTEEK